jgi:SAM-dependent methyltransferase
LTDEIERIARAYRGYEEESLATKRWSLANRGNRAALDERQRTIRKMLTANGWVPLGSRRVLEVGCGTGAELARLLEFGAEPQRLVGVDLLAERVAAAKAAFPALDLRVANAEKLEFSDGEFDLVVAMTLFSSIRDTDMAHNVAAEIQRVLRPGGAVLWYDFRYDNPRNPNVHGINEAAIRSLFPGLRGPLTAVTLLPPLARRLGPLTRALYPVLASAPPLRTHLVGLLSLPPSGGGSGRGA